MRIILRRLTHNDRLKKYWGVPKKWLTLTSWYETYERAAAAELLCAVHKHTARVNKEEPAVMQDDEELAAMQDDECQEELD